MTKVGWPMHPRHIGAEKNLGRDGSNSVSSSARGLSSPAVNTLLNRKTRHTEAPDLRNDKLIDGSSSVPFSTIIPARKYFR